MGVSTKGLLGLYSSETERMLQGRPTDWRTNTFLGRVVGDDGLVVGDDGLLRLVLFSRVGNCIELGQE